MVSKHMAIATEELPVEFMMNALRLVEGVPYTLFVERTGLPLESTEKTIRSLIKKGLLIDSPTQLATTPRGQALLNSVVAEFMA